MTHYFLGLEDICEPTILPSSYIKPSLTGKPNVYDVVVDRRRRKFCDDNPMSKAGEFEIYNDELNKKLKGKVLYLLTVIK